MCLLIVDKTYLLILELARQKMLFMHIIDKNKSHLYSVNVFEINQILTYS